MESHARIKEKKMRRFQMKITVKILYDYFFLSIVAFIMSIAIGVFLVDADVMP